MFFRWIKLINITKYITSLDAGTFSQILDFDKTKGQVALAFAYF